MVVIPAGSFMMGSPASEEGRSDDEGPVHRVMISHPFAVGKYEVTREEFGRFVSATGRSMGNSCYTFEDGKWQKRSGRSWQNPGYRQTGRDPVACVTWEDAQAYVRWLSGETGKQYRLLSEAEWEYAARAGMTTAHSWGDSIGRNRANCRKECGDNYDYTAPVGSFAANGFGLHDMHGNVWERVEDCWHGSYAGARGCPVEIAVSGSCAGAPGTAVRGTSAPPTGTGTVPAAGAATSGSVLPGRSHLESLPPYLGGPGAKPPAAAGVDFLHGFSRERVGAVA